jgi:hypothetical protein
MNYLTKFQGKVQSVDADDEIEAARRTVMGYLADDAIPSGASYEVRVASCANPLRHVAELTPIVDGGHLYVVDVAAERGRGSVSARLA